MFGTDNSIERIKGTAPQPRRAVKRTPDATDKPKPTAAQRSKAVWGAVEATGKQARAGDAVITKAMVSEQPAAVSVS